MASVPGTSIADTPADTKVGDANLPDDAEERRQQRLLGSQPAPGGSGDADNSARDSNSPVATPTDSSLQAQQVGQQARQEGDDKGGDVSAGGDSRPSSTSGIPPSPTGTSSPSNTQSNGPSGPSGNNQVANAPVADESTSGQTTVATDNGQGAPVPEAKAQAANTPADDSQQRDSKQADLEPQDTSPAGEAQIAVVSQNSVSSVTVTGPQSVSENAASGDVVASLNNANSRGNPCYTIVDNDGNIIAHPIFSVWGDDIRVRDGSALDYETAQSHTVRVMVSKHGEPPAYVEVTINVEDENDNAPVFSSLAQADFSEGVSNAVIYTAEADDADSDAAASTIEYQLTNDNGGLFTIDPTTGEVTITRALDFDSDVREYTLNIEATDGTHTTPLTVTLNLQEEVISVPQFSSPETANFFENTLDNPDVGVIYTAELMLPPNSGTFTYSLADNSGNIFAIDPNTGEVTVRFWRNFENPQHSKTYSIQIVATDGKGQTLFRNVELTLQDAEDRPFALPQFVGLSVMDFPENILSTQDIGVIFDAEVIGVGYGSADNVVFSLRGNDDGIFDIDPATGEITVVIPRDFENPNHPKSYKLEVVATSGNPLANPGAITQQITLNLADVEIESINSATPQNAPQLQIQEPFQGDSSDSASGGPIKTAGAGTQANEQPLWVSPLVDNQVDDMPMAGQFSLPDVDADSPTGTVVGLVPSMDEDASDVNKEFGVSFVVSGTDLSPADIAEFRVEWVTQSENNGQAGFRIIVDGPLHFDMMSNFVLYVKVDDPDGTPANEGGGSSMIVPVIFNLFEGNRDPSDLIFNHDVNLNSVIVAETAEGGDIVATLSTTDPDEGNSFSYRFIDDAGNGVDHPYFTIDGNVIKVKEGITIDADDPTQLMQRLKVEVSDQDGGSRDEILTINLLNNGGPLSLRVEAKVDNPSFELFDQEVNRPGGKYGTYEDGQLPGWTVENYVNVHSENLNNLGSTDGEHHLDLSSDKSSKISETVRNGAISQVLREVADDGEYIVTFDVKIADGDTASLKVYWGGKEELQLNSGNVGRYPPVEGKDGWYRVSLEIEGGIGDGTPEKNQLKFEETGDSGDDRGTLIDNVRLFVDTAGPEISPVLEFSIAENAMSGDVIGVVQVSDADSNANTNSDADDRYGFQITDVFGNRLTDTPFEINNKGEITVGPHTVLDYESDATPREFFVTVMNLDGDAVTEKVKINLIEVNDAPHEITLSDNTILENSAANSLVATLSANDQDAGDSFEFEITDLDGNPVPNDYFFIVNGNELRVKDGADLDFEADPLLEFYITVKDDGGRKAFSGDLTYTQKIAISVVDDPGTLDIVFGAAVDNPSFEIFAVDTVPVDGKTTTVSEIEGWNVENQVNVHHKNHDGLGSTDGNFHVDLSSETSVAKSDRNGAISQTLELVDNEQYALSFDVKLQSQDTAQLDVYWGGLLLENIRRDESDIYESLGDNWFRVTLELPGGQSLPDGTAKNLLEFREVGNADNSRGTLLDNVQVIAPNDRISLNEEVPGGTLVANLGVTNSDELGTEDYQYFFIDDAGDPVTSYGPFIIVSGSIYTKNGIEGQIDYETLTETGNPIELRIQVQDGLGHTTEKTLTIDINDIDEQASSVLSVEPLEISEDGGDISSQLQLVSGLQDGATYTFGELSPSGKGLLATNSDGSFTFQPKGAFEELGDGDTAMLTFTFEATDGVDRISGTQTIVVKGANDDPANIALTVSRTITENDGEMRIGLLSATDVDGDSVTFSVDESSKFRVVEENGEQYLELKVGETLNFEALGPSVSVMVTGDDGNGGVTTSSVSFPLVDDPSDNGADIPLLLKLGIENPSFEIFDQNVWRGRADGGSYGTYEDGQLSGWTVTNAVNVHDDTHRQYGSTDGEFHVDLSSDNNANFPESERNAEISQVVTSLADKGLLTFDVMLTDQTTSALEVYFGDDGPMTVRFDDLQQSNNIIDLGNGWFRVSMEITANGDVDTGTKNLLRFVEIGDAENNAIGTLIDNVQVFEIADPTSDQFTVGLKENAGAGTLVAELGAGEETLGQDYELPTGDYTYEVVADASGSSFPAGTEPKFKIVNENQLVRGDGDLSYEESATEDVYIRVIDVATGDADIKTIRVNLIDTNDAPTVIGLSSNEVAENAAADTVVGSFSPKDEDANNEGYTYEITDANGVPVDDARFDVDANGQLIVKDSSVLDADSGNGDVDIFVTVTDNSNGNGQFGEPVKSTHQVTLKVTAAENSLSLSYDAYVSNPSFEMFDDNVDRHSGGGGTYGIYRDGELPGWTVVNAVNIHSEGHNNLGAPDGEYHVDMASDTGEPRDQRDGEISQHIHSTAIGETYMLTFDVRLVGNTAELEVWWGGRVEFTVRYGDRGTYQEIAGEPGWYRVSKPIVGGVAIDVASMPQISRGLLEFKEVGGDNNDRGTLLDNVQIKPQDPNSGLTFGVLEGSLGGTVVASARLSDEDAADAAEENYQYGLESGSSNLFEVDPDTGEIRVAQGIGADGVVYNDFAPNDYTLTVRVTDGEGSSTTQEVVIRVAERPEAGAGQAPQSAAGASNFALRAEDDSAPDVAAPAADDEDEPVPISHQGSDGADQLDGDDGDNFFAGGKGDDQQNGLGGNDVFIYSKGDGTDIVNGGEGLDTLRLDGFKPTSYEADWTLELDSGTAEQVGNVFELSEEAAGAVVLDDGGRIEFDDIEQIQW